MLRTLFNTVARKGISAGRRWLQEDKPKKNVDFDTFDTAYPYLGHLFADLLNEEPDLRPHFVWGVLQGAHLAQALQIKHISCIEFGVAGGNGLLSLERIAAHVEKLLGIRIDVYGFDTGKGLPKPEDYRDLPNLFVERQYSMDVEQLQKRLKKAQLVLGLLENTIGPFIESSPAPVAFISFDVDYYSSTMEAFRLLEADQKVLLPRIQCYFDDIMGFTHSEFNGERLAISKFNCTHPMRKISPIYGLRHFVPPPHDRAIWTEMMFLAHNFNHELYGHYDGLEKRPPIGGTDLLCSLSVPLLNLLATGISLSSM